MKKAVLVLALATAVSTTAPSSAGASTNRPCGLGGSRAENRRLIKCLTHQPGLMPREGTAETVQIASCESGFYAKAKSPPYFGLFQMEHGEFKVFSHQGPRWVDREFREYGYGILSARGNALAALAHAHDHGFDYIGVCNG